MTKAEKIVELESAIRHWKTELHKIRFGCSGLGEGIVIFCDDYSKVNGYYERAHIPATVSLDIVIERVSAYIQKLEKEKLCVEQGALVTVLKVIGGWVPSFS